PSDAGALYRRRAPDLNVSLPPYHWQTFDILFRAPRFNEEGEKTENASISVVHNGVLVQDDVELEKGTGWGGRKQEVPRDHLYLQHHRGPTVFRNVWLIEDADAWPEAVKKRVFQ
ncbi:MAG: 3-keto-disaccharide hydrolase, partial [Myxococcota bacterium]